MHQAAAAKEARLATCQLLIEFDREQLQAKTNDSRPSVHMLKVRMMQLPCLICSLARAGTRSSKRRRTRQPRALPGERGVRACVPWLQSKGLTDFVWSPGRGERGCMQVACANTHGVRVPNFVFFFVRFLIIFHVLNRFRQKRRVLCSYRGTRSSGTMEDHADAVNQTLESAFQRSVSRGSGRWSWAKLETGWRGRFG